jgi:flagella basal body P-ring formation protein FlgA
MRFAALIVIALFPACLWADPASAMIEKLITGAWAPQDVRVEWTFSEKTPAALTQHDDWQLAEPRATRLAGSMIVTIERRNENGVLQRLAFSGSARVFGSALTVKKRVNAGECLDSANVERIEAEWTRLNGQPLAALTSSVPQVAARALVPGRPILTQDVKAAPRIRRGQTVSLLYAEGNVHVRLNGRALQDGAAGDTISVAAHIGKSKSFTGTVTEDGTVLLTR